MKTIGFVCSYNPDKAVISVPSMVSGITIQEIKRATEHCGKPLPSLSQGYFTIINNCQVALFKYKNTEALTKQPNICVGFPYIICMACSALHCCE